MTIQLDYGKKGLTVEVPRRNTTVVQPKRVEACADPETEIRSALTNPIGASSLREQAKGKKKFGIVFNDITRATPNGIIIPVIIEELRRAEATTEDITLFNATGTHRTNTDTELRSILNDFLVDTFTIVQNDVQKPDSFTEVCRTKAGKQVFLNSRFMECDLHILTGFIEPHFFAGFSGGPKAIMPGMASLSTIMENHDTTLLDHPNSTWGKTEENLLWNELKEIADMVPNRFLVNVTLNREKKITAVFAGGVTEAHKRGCLFARKTTMEQVDSLFDIVITSNSGYPLDLNLYQSVKGMSAASQIVKQGGSIIIATECSDGVPEHGLYGRLLAEASNLDELIKTVRRPDFKKQDMWQAYIQALICGKADVYVYSDGLSDEQIQTALLRPSKNITETVETLLARYGHNAAVCVLPEGPMTIPYVG